MSQKIIFQALLLLCLASTYAQENIGLMMDNFTPVNKSFLNPSEIVDQKPWLDISLVGVGVHARTNFLYSPKNRILNLGSKELIPIEGNKLSSASYMAQIFGPSASISLGRHSIGLTTAVRSYGIARRVPGIITDILADQNNANVVDGTFEANRARVKTLTWAEIGLTYGRILKSTGKDVYSGAVTLKSVHGLHESSVFIRNAQVDVDSGVATLNNLNSQFSYADPNTFIGRGMGVNLGFHYQRKLKNVDQYVPHTVISNCQSVDYKFKVGASLIDVGYINVKNGPRSGQITENSNLERLETTFDPTRDDLESISQSQNNYLAVLPAAISGQFDYNFENGLFVGGSFVQKLHMARLKGTERSNLAWVNVRYEHKLITAGIPVSLHNYRDPQLGFYVRIWGLSLGTENLVHYLVNTDMQSASFYADLRIPLFKNPSCKGGGKNKKGVSSCPSW
ncbi:MAG: DUF5723 family protein [Flavobacteriales bacterium]|nr:DUF5723 family protein [Flavobacteriales bacterium]